MEMMGMCRAGKGMYQKTGVRLFKEVQFAIVRNCSMLVGRCISGFRLLQTVPP